MRQGLLVLVSVLLFSGFANAFVSLPELVSVGLGQTFIPMGYDDNDQVQFVVDGVLSNSCYKLAPHEVSVDKNSRSIEVRSHAYKYSGICLQMLFDYHYTVDVGLLEAGDYKVVDAASQQVVGNLPVQVSQNEGPDDQLYAPVRDAVVDTKAGTVTLTGAFKQGCFKFKKIEVVKNASNVVLVKPIIDKDATADCDLGNYPFTEVRPLPQNISGRNLLHVRVLNGRSINKLFEM